MKPTLGQVFAFSLLGLAVVLALLFYVVFAASRATLLESSERIRERASREIEERVTRFLAKAPDAVRLVQVALNRGLVKARDPQAIEAALFTPLLADADIGELTLTYGEKLGFDKEGEIQLAPSPRGQWSVARGLGAHDEERFWSRHVHEENGAFVADRRDLEHGRTIAALPVIREPVAPIPDPTTHLTFTTPASEDFYGQQLWSDPHYSQLDASLPEAERRVEVSVQEVVTDAAGKFVGVLRVGLLARQLDRAVRLNLARDGAADPHRIFLCDAQGRLITRGAPSDHLRLVGENLRIDPQSLPGEITTALAAPSLRNLPDEMPMTSGEFHLRGADYLTTFRRLAGTQDWLVGIVVPRAFYLKKLSAMRDRLLLFSSAIILVLVAGGGLILRGVKRAQAQITRESLKMNAFEFSPSPTDSTFRDVSAVLESLESAKTAMRAMGKYVPVDLVRRLYREKSEPTLGGVDMEVSLMFTDIVGFTTVSEDLAPDVLAAALGRYLAVMAGIIQQETGGTIDKYIGDAIMTIWNAPVPVPEHARMACLAALRCRDAGRALPQTPEWRGLPPFETRFGLHRDTTLVGHFGAPDRMNYTAIGDAVNLASRLEGLNKQYGTTIIASESIFEQAREHFVFRRLDRVAVKGKTQAIQIYELLGANTEADARTEAVVEYERAFDAYLARDFSAAAAILEKHPGDGPSAVLLERCRAFQIEAPPSDWSGVSVATSK